MLTRIIRPSRCAAKVVGSAEMSAACATGGPISSQLSSAGTCPAASSPNCTAGNDTVTAIASTAFAAADATLRLSSSHIAVRASSAVSAMGKSLPLAIRASSSTAPRRTTG